MLNTKSYEGNLKIPPSVINLVSDREQETKVSKGIMGQQSIKFSLKICWKWVSPRTLCQSVLSINS